MHEYVSHYADGNELFVKITLAEYRMLVAYKATTEERYQMSSLDKNVEIKALKKRLAELTESDE